MAEKKQQAEVSSSEHEIRVSKVEDLKKQGIYAWPACPNVDSNCQQVLEQFSDEVESEKKYKLAGRLVALRDHGKTIFAKLQDRTGSIQLYIRKDEIGEDKFSFFSKYIDMGDFVWCVGSSFRTRKGEVTIRVNDFELISKCLHPLPEKYHGLTDTEQRYRQRYLDLISNPESKEKFIKRSKIVQMIRQYLLDKDFLEVETPMLHPIPGGASARPFVTHHNAYDMDLYLRIAPELYLKRLVVGGFDRVFEINRNFRNEGVSTKHNPEFTMLEFYMAYGDYKDGMELTEGLIQKAVENNFESSIFNFQEKKINFTAPFKKLTVEQALIEIGGFSADQISEKNIDGLLKQREMKIVGLQTHGAKLFALFEDAVEDKIWDPTFIIGYPIEISPLAKRDPENSSIASRFELFAAGMELANGFTELNDPFDQADRFKEQVKAKDAGDDEAHHYDADYIKALEYGLPPTVGVGIGIDRLTMLLTNTASIKDIILFPTMKKVKE